MRSLRNVKSNIYTVIDYTGSTCDATHFWFHLQVKLTSMDSRHCSNFSARV
jgi:hypothetical protein